MNAAKFERSAAPPSPFPLERKALSVPREHTRQFGKVVAQTVQYQSPPRRPALTQAVDVFLHWPQTKMAYASKVSIGHAG